MPSWLVSAGGDRTEIVDLDRYAVGVGMDEVLLSWGESFCFPPLSSENNTRTDAAIDVPY